MLISSYILLYSELSTSVIIQYLLLGSLYSLFIFLLLLKTTQGIYKRSETSLKNLELIQKYLDNDTVTTLDRFSRILNNSSGEYNTNFV